MTEPTKGLRVAFKEGMLGLHFVADENPYPEANGPADMAYINRLIEEDEKRGEGAEELWDGSPKGVVHTVYGSIPAPARVMPSVCGKPMPDGKGAGQCINVPGHEGECDDMPF